MSENCWLGLFSFWIVAYFQLQYFGTTRPPDPTDGSCEVPRIRLEMIPSDRTLDNVGVGDVKKSIAIRIIQKSHEDMSDSRYRILQNNGTILELVLLIYIYIYIRCILFVKRIFDFCAQCKIHQTLLSILRISHVSQLFCSCQLSTPTTESPC